jgi:hypothetical protein
MKTSDSKNLLDEDDALDYILYEEMAKCSKQRGNRKGGCLAVFVAVLVPVGGLAALQPVACVGWL